MELGVPGSPCLGSPDAAMPPAGTVLRHNFGSKGAHHVHTCAHMHTHTYHRVWLKRHPQDLGPTHAGSARPGSGSPTPSSVADPPRRSREPRRALLGEPAVGAEPSVLCGPLLEDGLHGCRRHPGPLMPGACLLGHASSGSQPS